MNRPHFHFTPEKGWINDPNGLVYIDGEYHLFYQHYPDDIVWGPMHWGHAVSKDLLYWDHKEIALYPDELGYIFSGSCIYDEENVSGLGTKDNPPLLAFFTHHDPQNGRQQQSIAYSLDKEHFIKYEGNPVIANTEKKDFRDPKVFENPVKGGYTMVVAAGEVIEFYHSDNLLNWERTGMFRPGTHGNGDLKPGTSQNGYGGICECPDCFPMETEEGIKWVLIISMCLSKEEVEKAIEAGECASAHVMQYYVGEFDGDTFIDTTCAGEPLLFEYGTDNYAAVTIAHSTEPVMIGWGENWNYVKETPAGGGQNPDKNGKMQYEYRGKMTLARKLALVNTRFGYRLQSNPVGAESIELCKPGNANADCKEKENGTKKLHMTLPEKAFHMKVQYGKVSEIVFTNDCNEAFVIRIEEERITVDRSSCGVEAATKKKHYDILHSPRFFPEGSSMDIIYDEGYFEIFAEDGFAPFSVMAYFSP